MSIYISKFANFCVPVRSSASKLHAAEGESRLIPTQSLIEAQFQIKPMPYTVRQQAIAAFASTGPHAFGSVPVETDGVVTSRDNLMNGSPYEGRPRELRLSMLDTNWFPPDQRDLVRTALDTHPELGSSFIRIEDEKTKPPFASYDSITGAGADKKLGRLLRDTGGRVEEWVAYESENQNRESVLAEYARIADERAVVQAEMEALSATV